MTYTPAKGAHTPADMVGNLVAKVAARGRAEAGDLYASTHSLIGGRSGVVAPYSPGRLDGLPTPDIREYRGLMGITAGRGAEGSAITALR